MSSQWELAKVAKAKKVPTWINDEKKQNDLITFMFDRERKKGHEIELPTDDDDALDWLESLFREMITEAAPLYAEKLLKASIKKNKDKPPKKKKVDKLYQTAATVKEILSQLPPTIDIDQVTMREMFTKVEEINNF